MRAIWALALVGCVEAPTERDVTSASTTAFANDQPAYQFFVGKGLTNFQAAGIVGNLDQESGVDPSSIEFGGGPGRGIAQWSVGGRWDTSTNDNVLAYATTKGESSGSLQLQLEFIWYELTTIGYGFPQLKAATNVTDATIAFMARYEICGTCAQSQRVAYANAVLAAYGAAPPYAGQYVSQSWPPATTPLQIKCGETVAAQIVLKNMGSSAWNSATKLGTTMPRDRASVFAGADWAATNRAAAIQGTVAAGQDGTFAFSFHAPTGAACVPGMYHEHFGLVQDGVAWFSDNGQGGPPDDQIEALLELVPGDGGGQGGSGSGSGSDTGGSGSGGLGGGSSSAGCGIGDSDASGIVVVALFGLVLRRARRAPRIAWLR